MAYEHFILYLSVRKILEAILFQRFGIYFNPSRVKVERLDTAQIGNITTIVLPGADTMKPMLALTSGVIVKCCLVEPGLRTVGDYSYMDKRVSIVPHSQEYELMEGKLGMVFDFESISAGIENGSLSFVTKRVYADNGVCCSNE